MLTTAAGTIPPAKVLIIGAGVAGLQAIATAAGWARSSPRTTRARSSPNRCKSLGAKFLEIDVGESGEGQGGYAKELSPEAIAKQRAAMVKAIGGSDVVITTAAIPGKRAPILVTAEAVAAMAPGSVIVDLAAETGGNVEGTQPGEIVTSANGVTIVGALNLPSIARVRREPPVRAQRASAAGLHHQRRRARARPRRRDRRRHDDRARRRDRARTDARRAHRRSRVTAHLLTELTIFILAVFVGIEVISKVPTTLHTPLMSATNAIHGIVLVGAILVAGAADAPFNAIVGFVLVLLASLNVFGGYTVTERMLADVPAASRKRRSRRRTAHW